MIAAKQTPTERHGGSDRAAPQRGGTDSAVERFHPYSAPCSIILNQPRRRHHPGNPCPSATPSVPVPCLDCTALTALCPCPRITYPSCASAVHTEHAACHTEYVLHRCTPHSTSLDDTAAPESLPSQRPRKHTGQDHAQRIAHNSPTPPPRPTLRPKRPVSRSTSSFLHGQLARGTAQVRRRFPTRAPSTPP